MAIKVGVLIGSLRKESYTRKVANALISLAPSALVLEEIAIGDLPLYNQDLEDSGNLPAAWVEFRERAKGIDAVLLLTPEYNRSIPAALKNALDVGSRPSGQGVFQGKPGAVVSVSPGALGGFGANHQLRQVLVTLNVPILQQPEIYIGNIASLLDGNGSINNESTVAMLKKFMQAYADWAELILRK